MILTVDIGNTNTVFGIYNGTLNIKKVQAKSFS